MEREAREEGREENSLQITSKIFSNTKLLSDIQEIVERAQHT